MKKRATEPTVIEWVSQKLKRLRTERGLALREVAERMGTVHSRVSDTESGRYDIKLSTLLRLLESLGTTPNDFFADMPLLREIGEGTREANRKREG